MKINVTDVIMSKGSRWTKGKFDRLYFNLKDFGLKIDTRPSGSIYNCEWKGERFSNSEGYRLLAVKAYLDIATGEIHIDKADRTDVGRENIKSALMEYLQA